MKTIMRQELQQIVNNHNSDENLLCGEALMTPGEMAMIEGLVVVDCPHTAACVICDHYDGCGGYNG